MGREGKGGMDLQRANSSSSNVPAGKRGAQRVEHSRGSNGMVTSRESTGARGSRGSTGGKRSSASDEVFGNEVLCSTKGLANTEAGSGREGGVGREEGVGRDGTLSTGDLTHTVAELSRRRLANDPAMMKELKRYRKLMLLTLLPAISGEADHVLPRPTNTTHSQDNEVPLGSRGQPDGTEDPLKETSEHLPRPEPTDGVILGGQGAKSAGSHRRPTSKSLPSGPASAGTRLPHSLRNPLDTSPRPSLRRWSNEETSSPQQRSRRRSHGDDWNETREESGEGLRGAGTGELDLLTLAALYLESRHRVLGQEWHARHDLPNTRPVGQLGSMGMARPRRLSPLSPSDMPLVALSEDDPDGRSYSAIMPTPAGLHLSVNYTQNLDLDESMYLAERARALRPRLRRLNSMENLMAETPNALIRDLHKATSAPDLSSSGHGRTRHDVVLSRVSSHENLSPYLVTPARANTPTEATHSAALTRPQIVGGSLVTNSAVDNAKIINSNYGQGFEGLSVQLLKNPLPHFSETSRPVLQPSRLPFRSPKVAADPRVLDLPRTPPPTATGEGVRRGGRVHLEPLTARKVSQ